MSVNDLVQMAGQFGFSGLLMGYIIWSEQRRDKQRAAETTRAQDLEERDIASREKLASSLTALSMVIQGRAADV